MRPDKTTRRTVAYGNWVQKAIQSASQKPRYTNEGPLKSEKRNDLGERVKTLPGIQKLCVYPLLTLDVEALFFVCGRDPTLTIHVRMTCARIWTNNLVERQPMQST